MKKRINKIWQVQDIIVVDILDEYLTVAIDPITFEVTNSDFIESCCQTIDLV